MKRVISFWSITGVISVALFISVEIGTAAVATVWAISGLLALNTLATITLGAIIAAPSFYCIIKICVLAYLTETDPANN